MTSSKIFVRFYDFRKFIGHLYNFRSLRRSQFVEATSVISFN